MALIKCPECQKEISDKAHICPHCGYPIEEQTIEEKEGQAIGEPILTFQERKSVASSILAVIFCEVIIGVAFGFSCTNSTTLIFAIIFCSFFEMLLAGALVTDIINIKKLNKMFGKSIYYNEETKSISFEDFNNRKYEIKLEDICQFDGPSTLRITYRKEGLKFRQAAILGCVKKEEVLKLREFKKEKIGS